MSDREKIKLQAIFTKDGKFVVTDQDGREFDYTDEREIFRVSERKNAVLLEFELEAPHMMWSDRPRVNLRFSIPLKAEDEMPAFIQEMIRERIG